MLDCRCSRLIFRLSDKKYAAIAPPAALLQGNEHVGDDDHGYHIPPSFIPPPLPVEPSKPGMGDAVRVSL